MANTSEARDLINEFLRARIPFVSIRSSELSRVQEILRDLAADGTFDILVHTLSQGLRDIRQQTVVADDRSLWGAIDFVGEQFQARANLTVVFTDVPHIGEDNDVTRRLIDLANVAEERGGCVVVVTSDPVWSRLQQTGMSVSLSVPDQDEMLTTIRDFLGGYATEVQLQWTDEEYRRAASILTGVTKTAAMNILAQLIARHLTSKTPITSDDIVMLTRSKDSIFNDLAGIERVELRDQDYQVGGLEGLRNWLERKRPLLTMDLRERGLRPPRGVLLLGVPGCGKSLSAKAVAWNWGLPLYRLDMGSIFGKYLGESENRFKDALTTADSVAPCVLWIDEIEKGLSGSGTDSTGATTRIVGQFLYWLQESTARVFVVATANDTRSLPQELLRTGRFDDLFFVDLPEPNERREIIEIYFERYFPKDPISDKMLADMIAVSEGFAGSDIASACKEVAQESVRLNNEMIPLEYALQAFRNVVPLSRSAPERIEELRRLADRALPASGRSRPADDRGPAGRRVII